MSTPPTLVSVVNQSSRVSADDALRMTVAVGRQLAEDYSPLYGIAPGIELVEYGGKPSEGSIACFLIDQPDVDGALGYHDEDEQGNAFIKVFANPTLDNGGTVLTGPNAVSVTLSHELLELAADAPANKWVDGPHGNDFAFEVCDPCEGDSYEKDGVSVSNFVLQAWFDPRASVGSKYDFLGRLDAPFTMSPGGYMITRNEPGKIENVMARHEYDMTTITPTMSVSSDGKMVTPEISISIQFGAAMPKWKKPAKIWKAVKLRSLRK